MPALIPRPDTIAGRKQRDARPSRCCTTRTPGGGASLVVIASLEEVDPLILYQVDEAMLLSDTP